MRVRLFAICCGFLAVNVFGAITQEQAAKLVAAAWELPPQSMDITYYEKTYDLSKDEQEIRQLFEKSVDELHGESIALSEREKKVQFNVSRVLKEQQVGKKIKFRIRYNEKGLRIDWADGSPRRTIYKGTKQERIISGRELGPDTLYERTFIEFEDKNKAFTSRDIYHEKKLILMTDRNRSFFSKSSEVPRFMSMPVGPAGLLKMRLGDRVNGVYEPNEIKIEQLCSGSLEKVSVEIEPDKNNPEAKEKVIISMASFLQMTLICEKGNYSKVYYFESRGFNNQRVMGTCRYSNFDSSGFPQNVISEIYGNEGQIKKRKIYEIEHCEIGMSISDEIFTENLAGYVKRDAY